MPIDVVLCALHQNPGALERAPHDLDPYPARLRLIFLTHTGKFEACAGVQLSRSARTSFPMRRARL
jgi:hypothetical protein